ncbi:MAG: homoserine dehydrogenase [Kineosporiaceae bacterium]
MRAVDRVRIALLGSGVVGSEVVRLLRDHAADLQARVGAPLDVVGIAVRRPDAPRAAHVDPALLTTDAAGLVRKADVVVELMGGLNPAHGLLLEAMDHGAGVVTANKALLAEHGPELFARAADRDVDLYFEAAVAGAIPLIRPLRESMAGDRVRRVLGIVNGTTNYVLDRMDRTGADLADALAEAQALGYAEADPTADVEGHDAAAKAAILASIAFHTRVPGSAVHREGMTGVTVRVHPALVPRSHPLAGVHGAYNAVYVEAEAAGQLMFYGPGAGGTPTAGAVLGDIVAVARHRVTGGRGPGESAYADLPVLPLADVRTRYHVRLGVEDRPGVLARVAEAFAGHGVSIEAVRQRPVEGGARADLVVVTHAAAESALAATVADLSGLDAVGEVTSVLRVEGM